MDSILSIILLLITFLFMWILNTKMPMHIDDYQYALVWGSNERITSFSDIVISLKNHYFSHGGRIIPFLVLEFFLMIGKSWFNPFNAFLFVMLILLIYWHAMKEFTLRLNPSIVLLIIAFCWLGLPRFGQVVLWMTGSCVYLLTTVLMLVFLLPYNYYYQERELFNDSWLSAMLMFIVGFISNWTVENIAATANFLTLYLLIWSIRNNRFRWWIFSGSTGALFGLVLLVAAPGNFVRYTLEKKAGFIAQVGNLFVAAGEITIYALPIILFIILCWRLLLKKEVSDRSAEEYYQQKSQRIKKYFIPLLMIVMLASYVYDSYISFALARLLYDGVLLPLGLALPNHETEFKLLKTMSGLEETVLYLFVVTYIYNIIFKQLRIAKSNVKGLTSKMSFRYMADKYQAVYIAIAAIALSLINHLVMVAAPAFPGRALFASTVMLVVAAISFFRVPYIYEQLLAKKRKIWLSFLVICIVVPMAVAVYYQYSLLHEYNEARLEYVKAMKEKGVMQLELEPLPIKNFVMQHVFFFEPGENYRAYYGTDNILVKGVRKPHPRYMESN